MKTFFKRFNLRRLSLLASAGAFLPLPAQAAEALSVQDMFWQADWVVKAVLISLLLASILCWCVFVAKALQIRAERRAQKLLLNRLLTHPEFLGAISDPALENHPSLVAAQAELSDSVGMLSDAEGVKERLVSRLSDLEATRSRQLSSQIGLLASIGSVAPFVGLFGTVWGIMNAFIGIAQSQTTSLAVVAPGIAEALLATAMGLVAAIPAVVIYNQLTLRVQSFMEDQSLDSAAVLRLVSRFLSAQNCDPSVPRKPSHSDAKVAGQ